MTLLTLKDEKICRTLDDSLDTAEHSGHKRTLRTQEDTQDIKKILRILHDLDTKGQLQHGDMLRKLKDTYNLYR